MTTSFALTVRGRWFDAAKTQLAGFVLALLTAGVALGAAVSVITGKRLTLNWYRINPDRLVMWAAAGVVAAWGLKIILVLYHGRT
jgi:hypothetical protein